MSSTKQHAAVSNALPDASASAASDDALQTKAEESDPSSVEDGAVLHTVAGEAKKEESNLSAQGVTLFPRRRYPSWGDLVALLGVYILATIAFGMASKLLVTAHVMDAGEAWIVAYVGSFLIAIFYALFVERLRTGARPRIFRSALRRCDPALVLWGVVVVLSASIVIEPLLALFPNHWLEGVSSRMEALGGWMMFSAVICAPILEETFFRGMIQRPLVGRFGPVRGILFGALIFGAVHGIPPQVVNALVVGVVLGYLYYKSQSLLPGIIIHGVYNAVSFFTWAVAGHQFTSLRDVLDAHTYQIVYWVACAVFAFAVAAMVRTFVRDARQKATATVEADPTKE